MSVHVISRPVEQLVINRLESAQWMEWRIKRYGYPCLTEREQEALSWELKAIMPSVGGQSERAVQRYIAEKMGITQGRVSQLLQNAERVLRYFEDQIFDH